MSVITADAKQRTDGSAYQLLEKVETTLPIVLVAWTEEFQFNEELLKISKYILCCFCEYGWDANLAESHIWGKNSENYSRYYNGDWIKFDNWIKENPPALLLKRELFKKDVSDKIVPIEYPSRHKASPQSKEEFNARPISVFHYWGRSNENRLILHGNTWVNAPKYNYSVCDNIYYLNPFLQDGEWADRWVTLNIPHYARQPMETIIQINGLSKISISMSGAGHKCFRHGEGSLNSVMATENLSLAWAYEWNETNAIFIEPGYEIPALINALKREDLYEVYLNGVVNCGKYYIDDYIENYIQPLVDNA